MGEKFNGCLQGIANKGSGHYNISGIKCGRDIKCFNGRNDIRKNFTNYNIYKNQKRLLDREIKDNFKLDHFKNYSENYRHFDKHQFLLLHCQFLVLSDYAKALNPDTFIEWSLVQDVIIWCQENPLCPICLSDPYPAKLTKCGHVFCWPCILHYLNLSDNYWRRCPICFESVKKNNLKSVQIKKIKAYKPGDKISFVLLKCQKGDDARIQVVKDCSVLDQQCFQKTIYIDKEYLVNEVLLPERQKLEYLARDDDFDNSSEMPFIIEALEIVQDKLNELEISPTVMNGVEHGALLINESIKEPIFNYFYQAIDGQPLFLHPLNTKMLLDSFPREIALNNVEFANYDKEEEGEEKDGLFASDEKIAAQPSNQTIPGVQKSSNSIFVRQTVTPNWKACPALLENLPITALETLTVTYEFRKRYRFLAHLPLHKELSFVEISFFKSDTLAMKIMEPVALRPNQFNLIQNTDLFYITVSTLLKFLPTIRSRALERIRNNKIKEKQSNHHNEMNKTFLSTMPNNNNVYDNGDFVFGNNFSEINLNSESDFPVAHTHTSNQKLDACTSSSWKPELDSSYQHLSFAQLVKEVTKNENEKSPVWTDVSKFKYQSRSLPTTTAISSLLPNSTSQTDDEDSDPELKSYIWDSGKQKLQNNNVNLMDILVKTNSSRKSRKE